MNKMYCQLATHTVNSESKFCKNEAIQFAIRKIGGKIYFERFCKRHYYEFYNSDVIINKEKYMKLILLT